MEERQRQRRRETPSPATVQLFQQRGDGVVVSKPRTGPFRTLKARLLADKPPSPPPRDPKSASIAAEVWRLPMWRATEAPPQPDPPDPPDSPRKVVGETEDTVRDEENPNTEKCRVEEEEDGDGDNNNNNNNTNTETHHREESHSSDKVLGARTSLRKKKVQKSRPHPVDVCSTESRGIDTRTLTKRLQHIQEEFDQRKKELRRAREGSDRRLGVKGSEGHNSGSRWGQFPPKCDPHYDERQGWIWPRLLSQTKHGGTVIPSQRACKLLAENVTELSRRVVQLKQLIHVGHSVKKHSSVP